MESAQWNAKTSRSNIENLFLWNIVLGAKTRFGSNSHISSIAIIWFKKFFCSSEPFWMFCRNFEMRLFSCGCQCMWYPLRSHFRLEQRFSQNTVNCQLWYSSFCLFLPHQYTPIFIEYCGNDSNACVVDRCREITRLQVVFCAHSPSPTMFIPPLNNTSVQCCTSTNLFQWSVNDGNCIATQSFDLDVCTFFGLRNFLPHLWTTLTPRNINETTIKITIFSS